MKILELFRCLVIWWPLVETGYIPMLKFTLNGIAMLAGLVLYIRNTTTIWNSLLVSAMCLYIRNEKYTTYILYLKIHARLPIYLMSCCLPVF